MTLKNRVAFVLIAVVGVASFALTIGRVSQRQRAAPAAESIRQTPQDTRTAAYISQVEKLDALERQLKSLGDADSDDASMILTTAAMQSSEAAPELAFNVMLADRRVARIFEELQGLSSEASRETCQKLFRDKLGLLRSDWVKFGAVLKDVEGPFLSPELRQRYLAVAASVFLAAQFCQADEVAAMMDSWQSSMTKACEEAGFDVAAYQKRSGLTLRDVFPEPLFVANIYAVVIERCGCADLDHLQKEDVPRIPRLSTRPVVKWNSTSRHGSKGPEESEILARVPYFSGWSGFVPGEMRSRAVKLLRQLVNGCPEQP